MNNKGKDLESEMSQEGFQRKVDDVVSGVHSELEMLGHPVEDAIFLSTTLNQHWMEWLSQCSDLEN
jgi:hypothetical protein